MGENQIACAFKGVLITRGNGTGAKRVMLENPERSNFIMSLTGWKGVEAGTLTVDHAKPLPLAVLMNVIALGTEPQDLLLSLGDFDKKIADLRGPPMYYGAVVRTEKKSYTAILSQQPAPACPHRLEIISDVRLRDRLEVMDGDTIHLDVYDKDVWQSMSSA